MALICNALRVPIRALCVLLSGALICNGLAKHLKFSRRTYSQVIPIPVTYKRVDYHDGLVKSCAC